MPRRTDNARLLSANARSIAKAVKSAKLPLNVVTEFRISGVRGLVLHVLPSGTATWYVHYDMLVGKTRKRRKHKIGRFDEVSLADAIDEAEQLRPEIRKGADPASGRALLKDAITFAQLAEMRLTNGDALRTSTERDYRHMLGKDILPVIGELLADRVKRQDILDLIKRISVRGSTRRADTARIVVSSIYKYGLDYGIVQQNPAKDIRNRHDYQPRDVVLSPDDLRTLWNAIENSEAVMSPPMKAIFKVALLTGQRRAEIAQTRKDDIEHDTANPCLTIGRGRAKNNTQHRVPLTPLAYELILDASDGSGRSDYVFANPIGEAIKPRSVSKAMERTRAKLGLPGKTVHDLRRTVGSMMTRFGVPREVRERVLNHGGKRTGNVTESVYSWYDYDAEKRAALELWADALACIVSGQETEIEDYGTRLARLKGGGTIRIA